MDAPFALLVRLDSGEQLERGSWRTLEQAIEQGQFWLETITDFTAFSISAGAELVYTASRPRLFTPPRRSRPSALSGQGSLQSHWTARLAA